ncbi:hypothetical protein CROQUDRAFT_97709 [Cronartium quercuum f. sp. fusiforme G11]|uniref:Uncharacterized protein n=1 Tax=Cronartium quercuum f. sp. fusiforme G11 TaxID=708437 RepID=A0A9P6T996_9BASI|nr:hypothetical protein CROQUDRAFT_97709 [Cronartium quercuum f. sp. fusiforme G11]
MDNFNASRPKPTPLTQQARPQPTCVIPQTPQVTPQTPQNLASGGSNPFTQLSQQVAVKGLSKFDVRHLSLKRTQLGVECLPEDNVFGTPCSKQFIDMFPGCTGNPSITKALDKLHHLLEVALLLPKGGGKAVTINSNFVTNICIIFTKIMEMDERRFTARF